ncbi:MAG: hypothetical protein GWP03_00755 [Proteobacteria bacterium]|nr:hypothetical protein [Pseudomonadota bacterium]
MKKSLGIRFLLFFTIFISVNISIKGETPVDTITQNIKLETPDIYIFGKISKGSNIVFRNDLLYKLVDNARPNTRYLNSAFVEKHMIQYFPLISLYTGIIYDRLPSENFGLIFQKKINGYTPYFDLYWSRYGYLFSGNSYKSPKSGIKLGIQSESKYLSDIYFKYSYYDFTFYNNTKYHLMKLALSNYLGIVSMNKINNDLSLGIDGKYTYKNGDFNYGLIYQGFADTLNRFVKFGIDTRLPEIAHNTLTIGFAVYPLVSYIPHVFANLSMNLGNFGYSISYSMEKNIQSASDQFYENNFVISTRSFITNKKHHIHPVFYINSGNFSVDFIGDYYAADSLLINVFNTSYTTVVLNNVQTYSLTVNSKYSTDKMGIESYVSYHGMLSNLYSSKPDDPALKIGLLAEFPFLRSVIFKTKLNFDFVNRNIANIKYPDSYGINFEITKSFNKNIKTSFEANDLLNSYYEYNNIIPRKGRNFRITLMFTI